VDAFFGYCFGKLPYRSIRFEHEHLPGTRTYQPVGTVNFPNDYEYTRITEFKHLTGQAHSGTSIVREFPQDEGDPYYPIPRAANEALYQRYSALTLAETGVTFVGRLAQYRYYNMDQCVGAALKSSQYVLDKLGLPVLSDLKSELAEAPSKSPVPSSIQPNRQSQLQSTRLRERSVARRSS
jgi:UDP-galactopyranose mutase